MGPFSSQELGVWTAALVAPFIPTVPDSETRLNHRLDELCFALGIWSRKQDAQIQRVILTDECGRLVLDGRRQSHHESNRNMYLLSDGTFHLADRNLENYTRVVYSVEPRYLMCAKELFTVVHAVGEEKPYTWSSIPTELR
jgi:hypothetical protein